MKSVKHNPVILITGASKGIGFDLATRFSSQGFRVVGCARSRPVTPFTFDFVEGDLTNVEDVKRVVRYLDETYHQLDILVNNAGMGYGGAIEDMPEDAFLMTLSLNVLALDSVIRHTLPLLKHRKGWIINIGSVAGDLAIPFQTYYSSSKAAVERYGEALRNELKPFGVRVVTIKPGDTKSDFGTNRKKIVLKHSPYYDRIQRSLARMETDEKQGMPTVSVFHTIRRLLRLKNPPVSVTIGWSYKMLVGLNRILPKKVVQWLIYRLYGK